MIRIMLVEDEPPILRELSGIILSLGDEFEVVATAANGDAALDELRELKGGLDILITDLHIPGVDGLTLIETVRREYPEVTCAILTGYSEFAYAKKAIDLQVADYLLKPVQKDALSALLERCSLKRWFGNATPRGEFRLGENGDLYAAVLCIGAYPYYSSLENILPLDLWDYFTLNDALSNNDVLSASLIEDGFASSVKNVVFSLQPGKFPVDASSLFATVQKGPIPLNIAICKASGIDDVRQAIQASCKHLHQNIVFGKSGLFFCDRESVTPPKRNWLAAGELEALSSLLIKGKLAVFQSECKRFLHNMRQCDITQRQAVLALSQLYDACAADYASVPVSEISSGEIINEAFMLSDNYDNLSENILSLFSDLHYQAAAVLPASGGRDAILAQMDAYIQSRYWQQLSTAQLAKEFGFTPAYLSKFFREYRHMSPLEYIVQLRIEKAQRLLLNDLVLSVREVAASVGYEDPLYFSKVFKKVVGVSPKQYVEAKGGKYARI